MDLLEVKPIPLVMAKRQPSTVSAISFQSDPSDANGPMRELEIAETLKEVKKQNEVLHSNDTKYAEQQAAIRKIIHRDEEQLEKVNSSIAINDRKIAVIKKEFNSVIQTLQKIESSRRYKIEMKRMNGIRENEVLGSLVHKHRINTEKQRELNVNLQEQKLRRHDKLPTRNMLEEKIAESESKLYAVTSSREENEKQMTKSDEYLQELKLIAYEENINLGAIDEIRENEIVESRKYLVDEREGSGVSSSVRKAASKDSSVTTKESGLRNMRMDTFVPVKSQDEAKKPELDTIGKTRSASFEPSAAADSVSVSEDESVEVELTPTSPDTEKQEEEDSGIDSDQALDQGAVNLKRSSTAHGRIQNSSFFGFKRNRNKLPPTGTPPTKKKSESVAPKKEDVKEVIAAPTTPEKQDLSTETKSQKVEEAAKPLNDAKDTTADDVISLSSMTEAQKEEENATESVAESKTSASVAESKSSQQPETILAKPSNDDKAMCFYIPDKPTMLKRSTTNLTQKSNDKPIGILKTRSFQTNPIPSFGSRSVNTNPSEDKSEVKSVVSKKSSSSSGMRPALPRGISSSASSRVSKSSEKKEVQADSPKSDVKEEAKSYSEELDNMNDDPLTLKRTRTAGSAIGWQYPLSSELGPRPSTTGGTVKNDLSNDSCTDEFTGANELPKDVLEKSTKDTSDKSMNSKTNSKTSKDTKESNPSADDTDRVRNTSSRALHPISGAVVTPEKIAPSPMFTPTRTIQRRKTKKVYKITQGLKSQKSTVVDKPVVEKEEAETVVRSDSIETSKEKKKSRSFRLKMW